MSTTKSKIIELPPTVPSMGPPQLDKASAALVVEKVRELLRARYATQTELATALRVSQSAISQWLGGRALPSFTNARRVAQVAGVSVEDLLQLRQEVPDMLGSILDARPNLRAAVEFFREGQPAHEEAVRAVVAAAHHLPDLERGLWVSMLEQVDRTGGPPSLPPSKKKRLS